MVPKLPVGHIPECRHEVVETKSEVPLFVNDEAVPITVQKLEKTTRSSIFDAE